MRWAIGRSYFGSYPNESLTGWCTWSKKAFAARTLSSPASGPRSKFYSQYARVETPDGREVPLAEYLEKVWEVVGRAALEQVLGTAEARARNGGAGALEEDARLTALFLWTLQAAQNGAASEVN